MSTSDLPRVFGNYLLTAALGEDALGRAFRAVRLSGEKAFVRLRILESPELSEDALLDAIQEYGEIHTFLKNPAITREVQMDAVEGAPFIAWNEESGRTLDAVLAKVTAMGQQVPPEHALLITEKVATALDHAHNTTVDGERTLHGLVWPGFVCISDDGETRLTGFGLAAGILPALEKPRLAAELAAYIAPEVRAERKAGKNSDVFSVGVLLFELLAGRLPSAEDPLADVRTLARQEGNALTPEVIAVLRTALSPRESRFQSAGELRRELGKLLFSGPYSPSTFNLAFFLNHLFGSEIEEETRAREREARLDPAAVLAKKTAPPPVPPRAPEPLQRPSVSRTAVMAKPPAQGDRGTARSPAELRGDREIAAKRERSPPVQAKPRPVPFVLAALVAAAIVGAVYVVWRAPARPSGATPVQRAAVIPSPAYTPTALPTPEASAPTVEMTDAQFTEEVSRRVAAELKRLEQELREREKDRKEGGKTAEAPKSPQPPPSEEATPQPVPAEVAEAAVPPSPTTVPEPVRIASRELPSASPPVQPSREPATTPPEETATPARIKKVIKPSYPPIALRQRIGGIVILRVLVSETGDPLDVQVLRGVRGGLSEAAAAAVRRWTFEPATKNGRPVEAWTTVPIPFEP